MKKKNAKVIPIKKEIPKVEKPPLDKSIKKRVSAIYFNSLQEINELLNGSHD